MTDPASPLAPWQADIERRYGYGLIDRYLLGLLPRHFFISLAVILLVLLLERLLRLFDLAATSEGALGAIALMSAHLVPHYLGLALPAALFFGLFVVSVRLSDNSELDVLLATGHSMARITAPFVLLAVLLSLLSVWLYGFMQPYSRYRYHVVVNEVVHAGWNARLQARSFVDAGRGFVLTADAVDGSGRELSGVFMRRAQGDTEQIISARGGSLRPSADGRRLLLDLRDGLMIEDEPEGSVSRIGFESGTFNEDFATAAPPFRPRGDSQRELTLIELWHNMHAPAPALPQGQLSGEFYGRVARILSLPLLPLLAVPLGVASKRGRRLPGMIVANLLLLLLHQGVQLGVSLAETGAAPAPVSVGVPFAAFVALTLWLFVTSLERPGDNPASRSVEWLAQRLQGLGRRRRAAAVSAP